MFNLDYFKSEYIRATDSVSVSVGLDGAKYNGTFQVINIFKYFCAILEPQLSTKMLVYFFFNTITIYVFSNMGGPVCH